MNPPERLPGLDLLRSAAIVWVMLFHSFLVGGLGPDWSWASRHGWMGVDLFFVLSGYLIGAQVLQPLVRGQAFSWAGFYQRRALRILPAYLAVLLLYVVWPGFREAPGLAPLWMFLSFTLNLGIDYGRDAAFSHAWSLCVEEHFYLLLPVMALALRRACRQRTWPLWAVVGLIVLGGMAWRALVWQHGMATDPSLQRNWFVEELYYPSWNRLDGLLCGVLLAAWRCARPQSWAAARRHADAAALLGLAGLGLAFWLFRDRVGLPGNTVGWPVLSLALAALVFSAAQADSVLGRCRLPGAGWLAAISYSLYLVHKPVYHLVQQQAGGWVAGGGVVAFAAYGAAAVLAGAALHLAVERPGLRLRDWLARRHALRAALTA